MLRKYIAFITAPAVFVCSCSNDFNVQPRPLGNKGGDDDDPPIIVEMVRNQYQSPVNNAAFMMVKDADTVSGLTDEEGVCVLLLTSRGSWKVFINAEEYEPVVDLQEIVADTTIRQDFLTQ